MVVVRLFVKVMEGIKDSTVLINPQRLASEAEILTTQKAQLLGGSQ